MIGHVPPLLVFHLVVGSALLLFGFRLKRSFRWVLIFAGGIEVAAVILFFAVLPLLGRG